MEGVGPVAAAVAAVMVVAAEATFTFVQGVGCSMSLLHPAKCHVCDRPSPNEDMVGVEPERGHDGGDRVGGVICGGGKKERMFVAGNSGGSEHNGKGSDDGNDRRGRGRGRGWGRGR